ncbi:uncharacterized protein LOC133842908 [Drosophila sulfurigaster albostrigata]|uniref:uncharacterized protein LOC133842908 n=1 Tax=Drosophila sulfurigaster albostrigata TaxID=89887 RepID=UPI002D21C718|nr:uncharacterized protein LOC133842908 [Drosophila sulfurigaster albostrigata]
MWKQQNLSIPLVISICIHCLMQVSAGALPMEVPRYNQLGHKPPQATNSSAYNSSLVPTTDRLGGKHPEQTVTTAAPQFEYALLGHDPEDQRWYRVSLTPTNNNNKFGYRAQFATRKSPPFDAQLAHKHDKTIQELLNFLERSEEHNLLKVYGQLLASEDHDESKIKRNIDDEIDGEENKLEVKQLLKSNGNRPLLLVGELPANTTPPHNKGQNGTEASMVKNFVYFIKGLK